MEKENLKITIVSQSLNELKERIKELLGKMLQTSLDLSIMNDKLSILNIEKKRIVFCIAQIKKLAMFNETLNTIKNLLSENKFKDIAPLLIVAKEISEHFNFTNNRVVEIEELLRSSIMDKLQKTFKPRIASLSDLLLIGESCLVIEVLGKKDVDKVKQWYCDRHLSNNPIQLPGESLNLDSFAKMHHWFQSLLKIYRERHYLAFPKDWNIESSLTKQYCIITNRDIATFLKNIAKSSIDLDKLEAAYLNCRNFEGILQKDFIAEKDFINLTSSFVPYLYMFVEAEQRKLEFFINNLQLKDDPYDQSQELFCVITDSYEHIKGLAKDMSRLLKITDDILVKFVKNHLQQRLIDLKKLKKKDIRPFYQILNSIDFNVGKLEMFRAAFPSSFPSSFNTSIVAPSITDEGGSIMTSELDTCFDASKQTFIVCETMAIMDVATFLMDKIEMIWPKMQKINQISSNQLQLEQSKYVNLLMTILSSTISILRNQLLNKDHFRRIGRALSSQFKDKYKSTLISMKPITLIHIEQLLTDLGTIRNIFIDFFGIKDVLDDSLSILLRALMLPMNDTTHFTDGFLLLYSGGKYDDLFDNLKMILDLKGVKKNEQVLVREELQKRIPKPPSAIV